VSSKKRSGKFLKGLAKYRVTKGLMPEVCEEYLRSLDCPRALTVWLLFSNGEHDQLAALEFNPSHYESFVGLRDAYAATKFLSKYKGLTLSNDLDEVAFKKFEEFELLCKRTNSRFRSLQSDPSFSGQTVWLHNAIIRKIDSILGEFEAEEFFSQPDWGPGASTRIKRREASPARKFQSETGITRGLYNLIGPSIMEKAYPLWWKTLSLSDFGKSFESGNKVITVPKDATTNRVIAIEPGINLWFQMSIGRMIGRRLRRCGVDLRWQSRNQELARIGSLNNSIATIDFSSASDSIANSVVEELLPPRWYHVMDACRSRFGNQSGRVVWWEKFSSMGNGFTFQLESLIFYAVAFCCADYLHQDVSLVSAYGDDVLLPSVCFDLFKKMVEFYGFRINGKKSHYDSPFRESCGAHYFLGVDVKPIYLKDKLESVLTIYRLANAIRRLAHRRNSFGCDARLRRAFDLLVSAVPLALRLRVPDGFGDGGFVSNFDEATPSRALHGIEGYHFVHVTEPGYTREDTSEGYLLHSLWKLPETDTEKYRRKVMRHHFLVRNILTRESPNARLEAIRELKSLQTGEGGGRNLIPLTGSTRLRLAKSLAQQWYNLGPWL
jgi:hypothetical protein